MSQPLTLTPVELETTAPALDANSRTVRSALWAAWGDALGFPVELAREPRELQRRFGADLVESPPRWLRRVGGRFGPDVELPAGTYSDDTQLRLAVCRCLRANGRFDAEAFSKIELPVFLSYELGAGRGTRAAAHSLMRRAVRWNSNFFADGGAKYVAGGGNGAAMRIQPHVWGAPDHRADAYLPSLLRDAVTTHGHPRGILGAAWHALALGAALRDGEIPSPAQWPELVRATSRVPARMAADEALHERWLPLWERAAERSFASAAAETINECELLAAEAADAAKQDGSLDERYGVLASRLGGMNRQTRGSGTVTAALALWLAWSAKEDPAAGLRVAANLRGSDTDTVATLAGALLGAVANTEPPGELQDRELHAREAQRLDQLRSGAAVTDFPHPDPLQWQPPPTLSDAVGIADGVLAIAGLGICEPQGEPLPGKGREAVVWQWLRTEFGQTLLVKRRVDLAPMAETSLARARRTRPRTSQLGAPPQRQLAAAETTSQPVIETPVIETQQRRTPARGTVLPDHVDEAVALVVERGFEQVTIGRLLVHLARQPHGEEKAGIFAGLVARALREEERRRVRRADRAPAMPPDARADSAN